MSTPRVGNASTTGLQWVFALLSPVIYVVWSGLALKYLQHAFGIPSFQPDWLNYLIATFIPPCLPVGTVIFLFNGVGHMIFHTSM